MPAKLLQLAHAGTSHCARLGDQPGASRSWLRVPAGREGGSEIAIGRSKGRAAGIVRLPHPPPSGLGYNGWPLESVVLGQKGIQG